MIVTKKFTKYIKETLKKGKVGIIPTDTLYGIVGSALMPETVERIYAVRKRDSKKPMIVLLPSIASLTRFNIKLNSESRRLISRFWPGKISIVLPQSEKKFAYLHRGTQAIAFRVPDNQKLLKVLKKTGPLVAPSANTQGNKPAATVKEAFDYFDGAVDFYVDSGRLYGKPSTLIQLSNHSVLVLREGSIKAATVKKIATFDRKKKS
ncbi:MAG: hypothetical protein RIQ54_501 [Candidatus Parcubacteria bacterium]|jgi:L-threonylcarbamoyladenylate synthase